MESPLLKVFTAAVLVGAHKKKMMHLSPWYTGEGEGFDESAEGVVLLESCTGDYTLIDVFLLLSRTHFPPRQRTMTEGDTRRPHCLAGAETAQVRRPR